MTSPQKLNTYITFIESGEIFEIYPDAKGKNLLIETISEYDLSKEGVLFLKQAIPVLNSISVELKQKTIIER